MFEGATRGGIEPTNGIVNVLTSFMADRGEMDRTKWECVMAVLRSHDQEICKILPNVEVYTLAPPTSNSARKL